MELVRPNLYDTIILPDPSVGCGGGDISLGLRYGPSGGNDGTLFVQGAPYGVEMVQLLPVQLGEFCIELVPLICRDMIR